MGNAPSLWATLLMTRSGWVHANMRNLCTACGEEFCAYLAKLLSGHHLALNTTGFRKLSGFTREFSEVGGMFPLVLARDPDTNGITTSIINT
jgi:hypothetical protein